MDRGLLKEVILEQKKSIENLDLGVKREDLSRIKRFIRLSHAVIISGIRRVGKSTLLSQIIHNFYGETGYYLNFEDERLINFQLADFNRLYELCIELLGERKVFFFDEIQNVKKWEMFVRRMQERGFKFFVTGSNASLLSKELATKLTGRTMMLELYPFSFNEYLTFRGYSLDRKSLFLTQERGKIKRLFNEYLEKGGMPEYLKYKEDIILKRIYEDILYRDIVARYEIKEIKALRELGLYFLSNIGNLFSYNKLKGALGLGSVNTVKSYTEYLENAFLIFPVNIFSYSLKQQFIAPKKVYCIDNGLANAISFQFSKNRGRFLENLVFLELKRRYQEIYYYKTRNNLEVDFLIKEARTTKAIIQVTQSLSNIQVRQREIKALGLAMEELKLNKAIILTEEEEEQIRLKDKIIQVKPVYKWLLEREE